METSLHRQLKEHYAQVKGLGKGRTSEGEIEVKRGRYRIDVVRDDLLIEVQHGGLSAIRDKIRKLCDDNEVLVVKPIVARKRIIKLTERDGDLVSKRWSPKRGELADLFSELVHFTRTFPHKRLRLDALLVEVEELRYPGHGKRRRWRKNDHVAQDIRLAKVGESLSFRTAYDLWKLVPGKLPRQFDTSHLAKAMDSARWVAQRAAYALREMGAVEEVGKKGNARLYRKLPKQAVLKKSA